MRKAVLIAVFLFSIKALFGQEPRLVLPIGHTDRISSAQYSPDGKKILTASWDGTLKLWDANSGNLLLDWAGLSKERSGQFSADGKRILTILNDDVEIIDANTGVSLITIPHKGYAFDVAHFSHDGNKIATSLKKSETIEVWDSRSGKFLTEIPEYGGLPELPFSEDDRKLMVVEKSVEIWDILTSKKLLTLKGDGQNINAAGYSHDGKKIVTMSDDKIVKLWDAETGKLLFGLDTQLDKVEYAKFSPNDRKIVIFFQSGKLLQLWDAETGKFISNLAGNKDDINSVEFSSDSKKIISASWDHTIRIWDAQTGHLLSDWGQTQCFLTAQFSPDGKKFVTDNLRNFARTWDTETGKLLAEFNGHIAVVKKATLSPNGKIVAVDLQNKLEVWNLETGMPWPVLEYDPFYNYYPFSPDNKRIVSDSSRTPIIRNVISGTKIVSLKGHSDIIYYIEFSSNGKAIVTSSRDNTVKIWDAETGAIIANLKMHKDDSDYDTKILHFSPDGRKVITYSTDNTIQVWDIATGKIIVNLRGINEDVWSLEFSPNSKSFVVTYRYKFPNVYNSETGKLLFTLKSNFSNHHNAIFSPDGKNLITISYSGGKIFDAESGNVLGDLTGGLNMNEMARFSLDGKWVAVDCERNFTGLWNFETRTHVVDLTGKNAKFSPDSKTAITTTGIVAHIWDVKTGTRLFDLTGHTGAINTEYFSNDSKRVLTLSSDNTCKIWNTQTGQLIATFFTVDDADYFNQIPSGYYMCTQNAAKLLHYVTKNLEVITFDQLDIKYNRPDKVLEAIGCPDTALIHAYRKAYEKRIKKLGIDTNSFRSGYSVPKSDFLNRDQIEQQQEQKLGQLTLHIFGSDSTYNLDRFNVWVNQVPVYGIRGTSLKGWHKGPLDTTVTITLSQGDNRIETSVTDANGTESYHIPLYIKYVPDRPVDTLIHFVGIGINKFKDKNYNLSWSVKDIHDLALKFKEKYGGRCIIDTLFDENVTTANVIALKKKLLKSGVNDKVIVAYSGHGLLGKDYDYFLSTYNVDFKDPAKNGLPYDALENLLDSIPARKKLMLIDACHSGELDKDEMNRYTQTAAGRKKNGVTDPGHKGAKIEFTQKSGMSMASSFELMKQLFVNVGKSTGATIISAAGGVQYALEKNDLKNGVFTYSILENMQKNPHVNISALKQYVNKRVTELTAGMQVPTTRNETDVVDWEVW